MTPRDSDDRHDRDLEFYMKQYMVTQEKVLDKIGDSTDALNKHFVEHDKRAASFMAESCIQQERILSNQKVIFNQVLKYVIFPLIGMLAGVVGYRLVMPS